MVRDDICVIVQPDNVHVQVADTVTAEALKLRLMGRTLTPTAMFEVPLYGA